MTAPTASSPSAELSPPRGLRRGLLLAVPPAFAALTFFHPEEDPHELGDGVTQWLIVHTGQLGFTVLLAYAIWILLEGLTGWGVRLAKAALLLGTAGLLALSVAAYTWDRQLRRDHGTADIAARVGGDQRQ